jgi:hypothetical protein
VDEFCNAVVVGLDPDRSGALGRIPVVVERYTEIKIETLPYSIIPFYII